MANNKIIYDGTVLIDLTTDTVTADKLLVGAKAHDKSGEIITGTCNFDSNTQDATVTQDEILKGKTAFARGTKITGTMQNNGAVNGIISRKDSAYTIPQGFHDGSGKVGIDSTEQAKIISSNIRDGVTILGVLGTMTGTEDSKPQSKRVKPTSAEQTILPDEGFTCLSQVVVESIPYAESQNSAGGTTVTIG